MRSTFLILGGEFVGSLGARVCVAARPAGVSPEGIFAYWTIVFSSMSRQLFLNTKIAVHIHKYYNLSVADPFLHINWPLRSRMPAESSLSGYSTLAASGDQRLRAYGFRTTVCFC
ncbi:hypothetical protein BGW36DRAFT_387153 [Talaromyces proteolyticus]|uniref:Secreted protein n=1 Tax=Talaromyces proteolyticus TaxID=1131652 RepID=A0AAD4KK93_9EURO|nr:uncharacterized protein BGW36DRAFT_387153 [Talaromyces proteolyticus]KAH8692183.1 hypothetical protein BGW36DRAFT_387153 [Talaromyces proteolyticus]